MKRREFIAGLGGAVAWPVAARAQRPAPDASKRVARVAMIANRKVLVDTVRDELAQLGWIEGRNLRLDYRMTDGALSNAEGYAKELLQLKPDVIMAPSSATVSAWLQETRTTPIVFGGVSDPVGSGFVSSLARPGGNVTGFMIGEPSLAGKWLQLLRELAPQTVRAIAVVNPATTPLNGERFLLEFNEAARAIGLEPFAAPIAIPDDIEPTLEKVGSVPQSGIILIPSPFVASHAADIASAAIRRRLPVVGPYTDTTMAGALASYGAPQTRSLRAAAGYLDRILKGEKPADLPVQTLTKLDLSINLKTAKAIGLEVPSTLLARADEVIE
jgi:putative ABC transport system substrate-binding protein